MQEKEDKRHALLDKTIFTYTISHLSNSDKVRFYYALKGRNKTAGIITDLGIIQLGKTVLLADVKHEEEVSDFLASWGCQYSYLPVLIKDEEKNQPTTRLFSASPIDEARKRLTGDVWVDEEETEISADEPSIVAFPKICPATASRARISRAERSRYPLKTGEAKRISLWPEVAQARRPRIHKKKPDRGGIFSKALNKYGEIINLDSELEERRKQIDTVIERQIGIGRLKGIDDMLLESMPFVALDNCAFYRIQEQALIRQNKKTATASGEKTTEGRKREADGMGVRRTP